MRRVTLLFIPIALVLAVACGDDNGSDSEPTAQLTPLVTEQPTDAATEDPVETAEPTEDESGDDDNASSGELFGSFNPFSALQSLNGSAPASTQVDPALKAMLLTDADLPGFMGFGEYAFDVQGKQGGTFNAAASMFMSGDVATTGEFGTMVMSMVTTVPPGSDIGELEQLADLTQAEIDEISAAANQAGVGYSDVRPLDASGLGESGGAIHVEMDFAGLFSGLGAGESPVPGGLAMDMYVFARGERMLMLLVMYPGGGSAPVDGHALAEIMDGRAS
jgi:hypothetical protein